MSNNSCYTFGLLAGDHVITNSGNTDITGSLGSFNSITGAGTYEVTDKTILGSAINTVISNTINDYNTFIGLTPTLTIGTAEIGGVTYNPGVYNFTSPSVTFGVGSGKNVITLDGAGTYVFQVTNGTFTTDSTLATVTFTFINGAVAEQCFG